MTHQTFINHIYDYIRQILDKFDILWGIDVLGKIGILFILDILETLETYYDTSDIYQSHLWLYLWVKPVHIFLY